MLPVLFSVPFLKTCLAFPNTKLVFLRATEGPPPEEQGAISDIAVVSVKLGLGFCTYVILRSSTLYLIYAESPTFFKDDPHPC